jgi:hypothetical protein
MLNGNFISIEEIISEVVRDLGTSDEVPWDDLIVWAFESIRLVGANQAYVSDFDTATIVNYRVALPCNFINLRGILINGSVPVYTGDTFHNLLDKSPLGVSNYSGTLIAEGEIKTVSGTFKAGFPNAVRTEQEYTYSLNDSYIVTNCKEGEVTISYTALPIDENGFPMIPEEIRFRKAVKTYLIYKLDYIKWRNGKISSQLFQHSEQEWEFYVGSASNAAKMPDEAMTQTIKNLIMTLKADDSAYYRRFITPRDSNNLGQ